MWSECVNLVAVCFLNCVQNRCTYRYSKCIYKYICKCTVFMRSNSPVSRTQDCPQRLHSNLSKFAVCNHKQGKNNSGGRLDWIFTALNFMYESRRVVHMGHTCVADDAPNLWYS